MAFGLPLAFEGGYHNEGKKYQEGQVLRTPVFSEQTFGDLASAKQFYDRTPGVKFVRMTQDDKVAVRVVRQEFIDLLPFIAPILIKL